MSNRIEDIFTKVAARQIKQLGKPSGSRTSAKTPAKTGMIEIENDPDLLEMNERYAVVLVAGKTRVVYFEPGLFAGCRLPVFQTISDFRAFHDKRRKSIPTAAGTREVGIGSWWINHPGRRQYDSIGYYPNQSDPARLNLWQGFACEPKPGDCSLYMQHVRDNICAGNADHLRYTLDWMAHGVQHPDIQPGVAIVLRGKEGSGKGVFVTMLGRCYGAHFRHVVNEKHLTGNFNAHLQQCTLLYADEAFFAGDRGHESTLKALITEDSILIEPKGLDCFAVRNCVHLVMASNADWVVPAGADARRFFVLDVSDTQMQNTDYFGAIAAQMDNGGREALLWELLHRDIGTFDVRRVPQTAALAQQKQYSRRGVDQLIEILAHDGALPCAYEKNPRIALTSGEERGRGFWAAARSLVADLKYRSSPVMMRELRSNWSCAAWKSHSRRGVEFPPLPELRQLFDRRHGAQTWSEPTADWDSHSDGDSSPDGVPS